MRTTGLTLTMPITMAQSDNTRFELKKMFRGYRVMTASIRQGLNRLGFSIEDGKTHYKVFFKNNPHPIVISKTASDHRSGLNFVRNAMTVVRQSKE